MFSEKMSEITDQQAIQLCQELRNDIIKFVSNTGGHLASSLGVVELTVALHRVFDLNADRLVFDVGHQCYAHKILTGRREQMHTLRQYGGLSGFPKPNEHISDAFIAGHASNAVSVALGMARARTVAQKDYNVIALLGDGALTGGLAYEGLSNAGQSNEPMLVILNDNGMSITKNVGGIAAHLASQRLKPQYLRFKKIYRRVTNRGGAAGRMLYRITHKTKKLIKNALLTGSFFENMGFTYLGPVDGHDVKQLTRLLHYAKELDKPVLLHVKTVKGKGYAPAEREPDKFHGVGPFDPESGELRAKGGKKTFSSVFGETMCELAGECSDLCLITAAMQSGTGLDYFADVYPDRFFDVGIAEEHAAAMAAGMAKQNGLPVFAVYSSFLQRSYDMLIHDVAIQNLHVVFGIDRAGLVGEDGETHHGVFDIAYLSSVPGMKILCPSNFSELRSMLRRGVLNMDGPVAIRYPRGGEGLFSADCGAEDVSVVRTGNDLVIVAYGTMVNEAIQAAELAEKKGLSVAVLKLNSVAPLDVDSIYRYAKRTGKMLIAEECVESGCVGQRIAAHIMLRGANDISVSLVNLGDRFVPQGSVAQLRSMCGIDSAALFQRVWEMMN